MYWQKNIHYEVCSLGGKVELQKLPAFHKVQLKGLSLEETKLIKTIIWIEKIVDFCSMWKGVTDFRFFMSDGTFILNSCKCQSFKDLLGIF